MASYKHLSFKCFSKNAFVSKIFSQIVRPVLAALSVNGLIDRFAMCSYWSIIKMKDWPFSVWSLLTLSKYPFKRGLIYHENHA